MGSRQPDFNFHIDLARQQKRDVSDFLMPGGHYIPHLLAFCLERSAVGDFLHDAGPCLGHAVKAFYPRARMSQEPQHLGENKMLVLVFNAVIGNQQVGLRNDVHP